MEAPAKEQEDAPDHHAQDLLARVEAIDLQFRETLTDILRGGLKRTDVTPKPFQHIVNDLLINKRKNVLHIVATSQGKTETYLLAAHILRKQPGAGPIIVFSPLNSLINDQLQRIRQFGLHAYVFGNKDVFGQGHQTQTHKALLSNTVDVLFVTPDMIDYAARHRDHLFNNVIQLSAQYSDNQQQDTWRYVPLLVIDEIHVILEATDSYRHVWKDIWRQLPKYPWYKTAIKLGLSATLNKDGVKMVQNYIPVNWKLERGPLYRSAISVYAVAGKHTRATRIAFICDYIKRYNDKAVIIFVQSRNDCRVYCDAINALSIEERGGGVANIYHAKCADRTDIENRFKEGRIQYLVATKALGLGFDKSDVRTVIHVYTPSSIAQWYQEFGRAGRDEDPATAILLPSQPFKTDTIANDILPAYRYLEQRSYSRPLSEVKGHLIESLQLSDARVDEVIERGIKENIFEQVETSLNLIRSPTAREHLDVLVQVAVGAKNDLSYLNSLRTYQERCIWKQILIKLGDPTAADFRLCGQCSAGCCKGPYLEIRLNYYAGSNDIYKATTPVGTPVIALHMSEETVDRDPDRLKRVAAQMLPNFEIVPSVWAVSCITSRDSKTTEFAKEVAMALSLEFFDMVKLTGPNKGLSMKDAKRPEAKQEVLKKYEIDATQVPLMGSLLLYDDVLDTGTTMDHVVNLIKTINSSLDIYGFVPTMYRSLCGQKYTLS